MSRRPIRIMMVDDHLVVRDGLKSLLELTGEVEVVATATTAEEAIELLQTCACDLVLLDLELPSNDGIWCTRQIKERVQRLPVLVLTMHTDERLVVESIEAGADGYLIKSASGEEVLRALREVSNGKSYVDPRVAGSLLKRVRRSRTEEDVERGLSPREREILIFAAQGLNNKEIGERLMLAQNTIKTHLRSIYRKCGVPDRVQAVLYAIRAGLVPAGARDESGTMM